MRRNRQINIKMNEIEYSDLCYIKDRWLYKDKTIKNDAQLIRKIIKYYKNYVDRKLK